MKTARPIVRMSQAVDCESVLMEILRSLEMTVKPGPSIGP